MNETAITTSHFEFDLLEVSELILHRVFTRTDETVPDIRTSSKLTILDSKGLNTLQNRIVKAFGGKKGIEMDVRRKEDGSFFRYATIALHDNELFVSTTTEMPRLLNEAQSTRRLPGGLVLVLKGKVGANKKPFLAVIKADVHEGFVAKEDETAVFMSFLDDLALTPNQKLYKIGLVVFEKPADGVHDLYNPDPNHYRVFVYDDYMSAKETRPAASYFYSEFLGFEIRQSDRKLTRDFYNLTREFISKASLDDETKIDLQQSLYTELRVNNKGTINISEFSEDYLPQDIRDDYTEFMIDKGFPTTAVVKDLEYINNSLRKRKLVYSSKVEIYAPPEKFDELITVVSEDDNSTTLRIEGKIVAQQ